MVVPAQGADPASLVVIATVLEDNGAIVFKAYEGDEALALAKKEKPDLITLDLSIPGKSGSEVFDIFRNDGDLNSIPICIITGKPELRKLIYEHPIAPPEGYLDKPITEEDLILNIRKILEVGQHEKATSDG